MIHWWARNLQANQTNWHMKHFGIDQLINLTSHKKDIWKQWRCRANCKWFRLLKLNGLSTAMDTEITMLVSFDSKFIRQDQKQRRNGEACRASPTCFWLSLIYLISKGTFVVFCLSCIISRLNGKKKNSQNKWKADAVLFELHDVANALWRKSATTFNQSKRCYHGQRQY